MVVAIALSVFKSFYRSCYRFDAAWVLNVLDAVTHEGVKPFDLAYPIFVSWNVRYKGARQFKNVQVLLVLAHYTRHDAQRCAGSRSAVRNLR